MNSNKTFIKHSSSDLLQSVVNQMNPESKEMFISVVGLLANSGLSMSEINEVLYYSNKYLYAKTLELKKPFAVSSTKGERFNHLFH
ncbi:hypothetical protein [Companilactobacillus hulinensis]|uniref:hypothetical protein n=1 Tax=Companilactobacillus hulinensis TaxID=2486007 RepID=UPI000F77BE43|nr:hypothetical protein [Companilactobacillus hulinensis]